MTFHGLRHSHKTWLIADQIPEVAQARRLGHRIPDKIQHVYSHVAPEVDTRLLNALQHRWERALAELASRSWANAVAQHRAIPAPADKFAADVELHPSAS